MVPRQRRDLVWAQGDAWLGGGTWLFSEPQPSVRRLIDLAGFGWKPLRIDRHGAWIAATCTIAELAAAAWPQDWTAASLVDPSCRALLGSFKIWNMATIGGNICLGLPAGPMIALAAALDAVGTIWMPDGGERQMPIVNLVTGPRMTALRPGELLHALRIPAAALRRRAAFRRISLNAQGRSAVLLIGTRDAEDRFVLTVTAATKRPVQLRFEAIPVRAALLDGLAAAIPPELYYDDVHGRPDWRAHMTRHLAGAILADLAA